MFLLRVLDNSNSIPFRDTYGDAYSSAYSDTCGGGAYGGISLTGIYIIITNSLLTALAKVIITSINIFYLILFKTLFFKINIKEAINSLYIIFSSVSI